MSKAGQGDAHSNIITWLIPGHTSFQDTKHVGRLSDVAWLPLPSPIGGGSIAALLTETGTLLLMDVATPAELRPAATERMAKLHYLASHKPHASSSISQYVSNSVQMNRTVTNHSVTNLPHIERYLTPDTAGSDWVKLLYNKRLCTPKGFITAKFDRAGLRVYTRVSGSVCVTA